MPHSLRGSLVCGGNGAALKRDLELPGELLGQGTFGTVFRVRERHGGRWRVMKSILKNKDRTGAPLVVPVRPLPGSGWLGVVPLFLRGSPRFSQHFKFTSAITDFFWGGGIFLE